MTTHRTLILVAAFVVFSLRCTVGGTTHTAGHQATGVLGEADGSTTDKMEFAIEQNEPPVTMQGTRMISVPFEMVLQNVTSTELKVKRISLESLGGGPVEIVTTRWNYNKPIRPGRPSALNFGRR